MFYACDTILPDISKWKISNIKNYKHLCSFSVKEKEITESELFPSHQDISDIISYYSIDKKIKR